MRRLSIVGLAFAAIVTMVACEGFLSPSTTVVTNQTQNEPGDGGSGGSGGAPLACQGAVASVVIEQVAFTPCDASGGVVTVGCSGKITATPKNRDGSNVPEAVHGPEIDWNVEFGSQFLRIDDDANPFNKNVEGVLPGEFRVSATVCGVTGSWGGRVQ